MDSVNHLSALLISHIIIIVIIIIINSCSGGGGGGSCAGRVISHHWILGNTLKPNHIVFKLEKYFFFLIETPVS